MIGGLLSKSTSRVALFAAAGLFMGGVALPSAKAADLGGDCCADLEERVAELEATTARKGNRKMSLTITGQVNRMVLWFDDGRLSKTYFGLDNTNSSSRFSFQGEAKVNPSVKMGFEIMIEIEAGGTSSKVSQLDEDGSISSTQPLSNFVKFNAANTDAYFGDARRVAWWIEHKDVGRLTVGRFESAGVVTTIDLAGISVVASSSFSLVNGFFNMRSARSGQLLSALWGAQMMDPAAAQGRTELVRYDSPLWNGFILSSSIAEAGDYWGAMLRYAGEFSGIRIAAGIGMEEVRDVNTGNNVDPAAALFTGPTPNTHAVGGAVSALHVPSGLFAQGHYQAVNFGNGVLSDNYWGNALICSNGQIGQIGAGAGAIPCSATAGANKKDASQWLIQAGVAKNWFGIGNTALYGEYGKATDFGALDGKGRDYPTTGFFTAPFNAPQQSSTNFGGILGVTDTEITVLGVGVTQNIDAASTTLYLGYRNFSAKVNGTEFSCTGGTLAAPAGVGTPCAATALGTPKIEDINVIIGGAVVRF